MTDAIYTISTQPMDEDNGLWLGEICIDVGLTYNFDTQWIERELVAVYFDGERREFRGSPFEVDFMCMVDRALPVEKMREILNEDPEFRFARQHIYSAYAADKEHAHWRQRP